MQQKQGHPQDIRDETIYQHIWKDKCNGGTLYKQLRHRGKKYNKRSCCKSGRGCIPNRVDIEQRPKIVEQKLRLWDWELDTIISRGHKGVIVSMVDRASKFTKLALVSRETASNLTSALLGKLAPVKDFVLTMTADNGKEFANHIGLSRIFEAGFFFARPYHSWERGLNEHTNGLVRQYFPKTMAFDEITQKKLDEVEILLNNRPRKVLEHEAPTEILTELSRRSPIVAPQT